MQKAKLLIRASPRARKCFHCKKLSKAVIKGTINSKTNKQLITTQFPFLNPICGSRFGQIQGPFVSLSGLNLSSIIGFQRFGVEKSSSRYSLLASKLSRYGKAVFRYPLKTKV